MDEHLVAFFKPAQLPTEPTIDPLRESLYHRGIKTLVSSIQETYPRAYPYLRVVHRLDRDTSGVVLMSRSSEASKSLGDSFKHRQVHKRYWLLCGRPDQGQLARYIDHTQGTEDIALLSHLDQLHQWAYDQGPEHLPQAQPLKVKAAIGRVSSPKGQHLRWGTPTRLGSESRINQVRTKWASNQVLIKY